MHGSPCGSAIEPIAAAVLTLRAADRYGNFRTADDGTPGIIAYFTFAGGATASTLPGGGNPVAAVDNNDGTWSTSAVFNRVGNYTVQVTVGGALAGNSTFMLAVAAPIPIVEAVMQASYPLTVAWW